MGDDTGKPCDTRDLVVTCLCLILMVLGIVFLATSTVHRLLLYVGIFFCSLAFLLAVIYIIWRWCCRSKSDSDNPSRDCLSSFCLSFCCCWLCCYGNDNCCCCRTSSGDNSVFGTVFCMPGSQHGQGGTSRRRRNSMTLRERRLANVTLQLRRQQEHQRQGTSETAVRCQLRNIECEIQKLTGDYEYLERNAVDAQMLRSHYRALVDQFLLLSGWIEGRTTVTMDQLQIIKVQLEMIRSDFKRERQQQRVLVRNRANRSFRHPSPEVVARCESSMGSCTASDPSCAAELNTNITQPPPYQELDPNPDPTLSASLSIISTSVQDYNRFSSVHNNQTTRAPSFSRSSTTQDNFWLPGYLSGSQYSLAPPPEGYDAPPVYDDVFGTVV